VLLWPAGALHVAVVGAHGTLASNTIITSKAVAAAGLAVTASLVGALRPWVQVVLVDDTSDPGVVLGAGAQRAVGTGPLGLAVKTQVAVAVVVQLASAVAGTGVLAQTSLAVAALVPSDLTPALSHERWS
jgi:hypothetical protein